MQHDRKYARVQLKQRKRQHTHTAVTVRFCEDKQRAMVAARAVAGRGQQRAERRVGPCRKQEARKITPDRERRKNGTAKKHGTLI